MPRIRSVKPEWLDDEQLGSCSDSARMVSIALITLADDHGNGRAHTMFLVSRIWAYADDPGEASRRLAASLGELERIGFVRLYTVKNQRYFTIPNWSKHQRISNAGKPLVPGPAEADEELAANRRESRLETERETERETEQEQERARDSAAAAAAAAAAECDRDAGTPVPDDSGRTYVSAADVCRVWGEVSAQLLTLNSNRGAAGEIALLCNAHFDPAKTLSLVLHHHWRPDGWAQTSGRATLSNLARTFHRELAEARGDSPRIRASRGASPIAPVSPAEDFGEELEF